MFNDDLQELIDRGIIDTDLLKSELDMARKKDILAQHTSKIWQNQESGFWYTYLPDPTQKNGRRMVKKRDYDVLIDEIYRYYTEHIENPTVNEIFRKWIESKSENVLPQTIMKYENNFKKYIEPTPLGKKKMKTVTFKDLSVFCSKTIGKDKMTAKCWAGIRTDLIGIIRQGKIDGFTNLSVSDLKDLDIAKNAFKTKIILPGEDVFTTAEADKLKAYIAEHEDDIELLGARLVFKTGLRVGELAALKRDDFDLKAGVLTVTRTEEKTSNPDSKGPKTIVIVREKTKGAKGWRQVVIDNETVELVRKIMALNPEGEYLFEKDGKRICANCWTKKIPRLCARLGIGEKSENGNWALKKSMHKERKNYASTLLHKGVDPKFVQSQLGHTDIHTTLAYYDREVESIEARKAALLPVLEQM